MSGVQTGSRLERLHRLLAHVQQEIAVESRRAALEKPISTPTPAKPGKGSGARTAELLDELDVDARHVKEWAVRNGLIPAVVRGRVSYELVQAYARSRGAW